MDSQLDAIEAFSLITVNPLTAKVWLKEQGWSDEALKAEASQPLFVEGAYALRPFFLRQLAPREIADQIAIGSLEDILSFLIKAMLRREQGKFGQDVEAVTTQEERTAFLSTLMEEIARDLAENQTDAIAAETLSWLAEAAADNIVPEVRGILKNRANVIAFLTDDVRRGYRRFIHEQVQNYFLCHSLIASIRDCELPKFVRRNILGLDFLENFTDVVRHYPAHEVEKFVQSAVQLLRGATSSDRSRTNLSAVIMATCSVVPSENEVTIEGVDIDEALLSETVVNLSFRGVAIGQLDARGCDMSGASFAEDCYIATLIADQGTIPTQTLPAPSILLLKEGTITEASSIDTWLESQFYENNSDVFEQFSLNEMLRKYPLFNLLSRLVRYRPFWLKDSDDKSARRILDDPYWQSLKDVLLKHDLLVERYDVQSSGPNAPFYHLRNRDALVNLDYPPSHVRPMLFDLARLSAEHEVNH